MSVLWQWLFGPSWDQQREAFHRELFPSGWKVGYVGMSPDGATVEWCGDAEVTRWLNAKMASEARARGQA